jgi:hypothetical protein
VRRTTTHDCIRNDGLHGPVRVVARGRDLHTDESGRPTVLATGALDLQLDFADGVITELSVEPRDPDARALVGRTTHRGFRAALDETLPSERHSGSIRWQLLDDLPMTVLLSGRVLRAAGIGLRRRDPNGPLPVDICAGWAEGGTLVAGYTEFGPPFRIGPTANEVEADGDAISWHEHEQLPPHATRRRRRLDVWLEENLAAVDCFFRDSYADGSGLETVVHEYTVRATVNPRTLHIVDCDAFAGELPYPECPGAAASAKRLVGMPSVELRPSVLAELTGPSTCTHLNDALRSLEDVGALLRSLRGA